MDKSALENEIINLISLKQEGSYWDFKKEWHCDCQDLLHDIICMANNLSNHDGYIIVGIDEENDFCIRGVAKDSNRRTTQNIVDFLRDKKFAGSIRPMVHIQILELENAVLDIIIIQNDRNSPYYLIENYKGVFANNIYTRVMDTNTPKNRSADINNIEYLWKKRFGIDATALERVMLFLQNPKDWMDSDNSSKKYYKFAPEFTIEDITAMEIRNDYEYYLFGQSDNRPHWYDINICFHQTTLVSLGGASLDGGRYFTATPLTDGISFNDYSGWDISYKYFIKGSIEYITHEFYYSGDRHEETFSRNRFLECVLVFDSKWEKIGFDQYVRKHFDECKDSFNEIRLPYFPQIKNYVMEAFKKDYSDALILKKMLEKYRT